MFSTLMAKRRFDVVICGHINLLFLAWLASRISAAPLVLITHGIEVWQPTSRWLNNWLTGKIDYLISVSETTRQRFQAWAPMKKKATFILPNCVDMTLFQPRSKNQGLVNRYKLQGKTVLMTLARLPSRERYKGVDEVLEVMPALLQSNPRLIYLVVGNGDDLSRLQEKARALGIDNQVIFTGAVNEIDKVDHYNLAEVFVMPGRGEGFGIVYLEAMACGVPVVASLLDGSKEAVLDGKLGVLVNPDSLTSVESGIREALARKRGIPAGLDYFSDVRFDERVHVILGKVSDSW
jgi:glycosyltransferase involved in cell wall biosynthesis